MLDTPPAIIEPAPESQGLPPGWWAGIIAGQVADAVTTSQAIARGGREVNPVMRWAAGDSTRLLVVKAGAGVGLAWVLHRAHRDRPRAAKTAAAIVTAIGIGVAVWNRHIQ